MTVKLGHIKRIIQRSINVLLKPHWIVLISFSASAFCWLIPDGVGLYQGYEEAQPLSVIALVFIFAWYFFIIFLSFFGFHLGQRFPAIREFNQSVPLHRSTVYYTYSLCRLDRHLLHYIRNSKCAGGEWICFISNGV